MVKNTKLAKKEDNSLVDSSKLFDSNYTGSNYSVGGISYPYIVILQSDKTFKNFVDGNSITKAQYGKLFIRSANQNHQDDLVDSFSGVIIKEQKGAEMWVEGQQVFSKTEFASQEEKDELAIKYSAEPRDVKNVIKLLIKLDKPIELKNGEDYSFAVITVKGASFMKYNDEVKVEQQRIFVDSLKEKLWKMGRKFNSVSQVPTVFFRIEVSSELVEDKKINRDYYVYSFQTKEVPLKEAVGNYKEFIDAADFNLISMKKNQESTSTVSNEPIEEAELIDNTKEVNEVFGNEEVSEGDIDLDDIKI